LRIFSPENEGTVAAHRSPEAAETRVPREQIKSYVVWFRRLREFQLKQT
jgi:hypothetical protein